MKAEAEATSAAASSKRQHKNKPRPWLQSGEGKDGRGGRTNVWCILTYLHAAAASTCASMAEKASAVNAKSERLSKPPPPLLLLQ